MDRNQVPPPQHGSDRVFRSVFDQSNDGILIVDAETRRFVETNATMCDLLGYDRQELLGLGIRDIHPPGVLTGVLAAFERAVRENLPIVESIPVLRKDGSCFIADLGHTTITLEGKVCAVGVFRARAVRKPRSTEPERGAAGRQVSLDSEDVGIALLKNKRFVWINRALEQMFGYRCDEVDGLSTESFYLTHDFVQQLRNKASLQLAVGESYRVERWMKRRDGSQFWCSISGKAIDPSDPAAGSIWIVQDITDEHGRHKEMSLGQERFGEDHDPSLADFTSFEDFLEEALVAASFVFASPSGCFALYDGDLSSMRTVALTPQAKEDSRVAVTQGSFPLDPAGVWSEVVRQRAPVLVNDFAARPHLKRGFPEGHVEITRLLAVPVLSGGDVVALAAVANKAEDYTAADARQFMLMMGSLWEIGRRKQAEKEQRRRRDDVMSINRELEDMVRQRTSELVVLSRRLIDVQEEERRHLARELHDEVGQALTGIRLGVENLCAHLPPERRDEGEGLIATIGELLVAVRRLSFDLRPSIIDDFGLVPALKWYFDRIRAASGFQVSFQRRVGRAQPDRRVEIALFRIAQEALTNVRRHAGVKAAEVKLSIGKMAKIEVRDRGAGFVHASWNLLHDSSGISGMSERATLLGGRFAVNSKPGQGTRVIAMIPLEHGAQPQGRKTRQ